MRLIEILEEKQYKTDKWTDHHYVQDIYEPLFAQYREKEINFCEVGVWNGESMKLWSDYFVKFKKHSWRRCFHESQVKKKLRRILMDLM